MKVLDFVVCDEIRHEIGDKISIMGVFIDSMLVNFHCRQLEGFAPPGHRNRFLSSE